MRLSLDLETRSDLDLRQVGVYRYAESPHTDVWCVAFSAGGDVELWVPGDPVPDVFFEATEFVAWNANFERIINNKILHPRYGFPYMEVEDTYCTMAQAAAMALPLSLGKCGEVLKVDQAKDKSARRLMLQMARPRLRTDDGPIFWSSRDKRHRLYEYCRQDVRAEQAVADKLVPLSAVERAVWVLDQKLNDRGLGLDLELAEAAKVMAARATAEVDAHVRLLTEGAVKSVRDVRGLREYLGLPDVRKATLEQNMGSLSDTERRVAEYRLGGAKTSVAKINKMIGCCGEDGRIRGLLQYHGAATGRWAGRLVQPQNLPRGEVDDPEQYVDLVLRNADVEEPMRVLSSMLRLMLVGDPVYMAGDFRQIEARVLFWLAGEKDALQEMAEGRDIYRRLASTIYDVEEDDVTPKQRQVGKMGILGAGFGMGPDTFRRQAQVQGVDISEEESANAIRTYRETFPGVVDLWRGLNTAARSATLDVGRTKVWVCSKVRFSLAGSYLTATLPSGRRLWYPSPSMARTVPPWVDPPEDGSPVPDADKIDSVTALSMTGGRWDRRPYYGGLWTENVVQGIARDVLAAALLRLELADFYPVLTVHDEVICEPKNETSLDRFKEVLEKQPTWAAGLPIESEVWTGKRYRK
jgi:DNA polymerase